MPISSVPRCLCMHLWLLCEMVEDTESWLLVASTRRISCSKFRNVSRRPQPSADLRVTHSIYLSEQRHPQRSPWSRESLSCSYWRTCGLSAPPYVFQTPTLLGYVASSARQACAPAFAWTPSRTHWSVKPGQFQCGQSQSLGIEVQEHSGHCSSWTAQCAANAGCYTEIQPAFTSP
jgi:hypothetical protein